MQDVDVEKPAKIVKRYANRKLYDTERSCYVTLDEISSMIKDGEEVRVVDNKTKEDLTAVTLAQIILEEEKKVSRMPLQLLRTIIQSSNEALSEFYQKRVADPMLTLRTDVEKRVDSIFKRDHTEEGAVTPTTSKPNEERNHPVKTFVTSTTEAFDAWQRNVDDTVKDTLARMTHLTQVGSDVKTLVTKLQNLEDRLANLEKDRTKTTAKSRRDDHGG